MSTLSIIKWQNEIEDGNKGAEIHESIHDTFVNKLRNFTTQEYLENNRPLEASG